MLNAQYYSNRVVISRVRVPQKHSLTFTDKSRPTRLPVIAEHSLPDAPAVLLFTAVPASVAQHWTPVTNAVQLQVQHAMLLRHRLHTS